VLDKYDVDYFLCPACELLQTEAPRWLDEAYAQAISALDTGAVQRNQAAARIAALVATLAEIAPDAACLDYGGGHGVLVRMMRDIGLDFRWFDKYAENLFARGFEGELEMHHALVTAFEVFEHLAEVGPELERLFAPRPDLVLVGTVLHGGYRPGWWYFMLESGQHVVFYGARTMAWIAERFGYDALVGPEHTLFVRRGFELGALRRRLLQALVRRPVAAANLVGLVPAPLLRRLSPYRSRMEADHQAMRAKA
jgi:methyltransferase family protein